MLIDTAAIVGLGALGVMYGHHLSRALPAGALQVAADTVRIEQYRRDGVYLNEERCAFDYVSPEEAQPAGIVLVAVKQPGLAGAIETIRPLVNGSTVILSLLNGISSERVLARAFGAEKVLLCVAQGMDAVREGRRVSCANMGWLVFGDADPGAPSEKAKSVAAFLEAAQVPHILAQDMPRRLWSKLMLNCGVNQVLAVYGGSYGSLVKPGPLRDMMLAAMREVMALARAEGIALGEEDITDWMALLATLNPAGKPSMQQDVEAKRRSEAELFGGTVEQLGIQHGIQTPVNTALYRRILEIESGY